jgi:hypothetical protein
MSKDVDAAVEQMDTLLPILSRMEGVFPITRSSRVRFWMSVGVMCGLLGVPYQDVRTELPRVQVSFLESILAIFKKKKKEDVDALVLDLWKRGHSKLTVLQHLFRSMGDQSRLNEFEAARKYIGDYLDLAAFSLD